MLISDNIGDKIKDLREYYGISQKALCEGICSQAYISRLEKGEINVSADILFLLSKRLGVEINFFFDHYNSPRSDYVTLTMNEISEATRERRYKQANEMVSLELKNPSINDSLEVKQFLLWHKGISLYHLGYGVQEAIKYIDSALSYSLTTNRNYSEREIEILLSKAIILLETTNYQGSKEVFEVIIYNLKQNIYLSNPKIYVRTYYNYSRLLINLEKFQEAINASRKGIHHAQENELMYLQGDLYFQIARCNERMGEFNKARENFQLAANCFELNNEDYLYELALERIDDLTNLSS